MFVIIFDRKTFDPFMSLCCSTVRALALIRRVTCLFISSLLMIDTGFATERVRDYHIPAQSLNNALVQFVAETNLELLFSADLLRGRKADALTGQLTKDQALKQLLQNTGYTYRFIDSNTVTIIPDAKPIAADSERTPPKAKKKSPALKILLPMTIIGNGNFFLENKANSTKSYRVSYGHSATKTLTPIKEIPQSILVVPKSLMSDQQNLNISESLRNVSGVITDHILLTPSFDSTLIRGFRAEQRLDGFTQYYNVGDRESLVNIDRIDVLKGTNALLYGGGTGSPAGGLVNIVSKLPHSQSQYEVGITLGSYQYYQPYIDVNQPVNEHILLRITGEYTHSGSHVDTLKTQRYNINPAIIFTNNKNTSFTLQAKISSWQQPDYQGLPATGTVSGSFSIDPDTFIGPRGILDSKAGFYGVWGTLEHAFNDIWSFSFKARYTQSKFDQKAQVIVGGDGFKANVPMLLPSTWALSNTQLFQEQQEVSLVLNATARFKLGLTDNTLLIGTDYSLLNDQGFIDFGLSAASTVDLRAPVFLQPYQPPGPGYNALFLKSTTYGEYFQLQSTFNDWLHLLVGVRLGSVIIDYKNIIPSFEFSANNHTLKLLPRIGTVLDISDQVSVFIDYSQGMRGQPFNNFVASPKPELSSQIEGGIKFDIAEQFSGQLALYQIDRSNVLGAASSELLESEGRQRSRGFEADLVWEASENLNFLANYAFTHAIFLNNQPGIPAGTFLPGVPSHAGRFWVDYDFSQSALSGLSLGAGIYAQSAAYLSSANKFKSDHYYSIDTSIAYEISPYQFGISIKNLTNVKYYERIDYLGGRVKPGQGISVFARFSVHY